jgi:hypothetical protein
MEEKEAGNGKRVRDRAMSKPSEFVVKAKKKKSMCTMSVRENIRKVSYIRP